MAVISDEAACRCWDAELFFPAAGTGVALDQVHAAKSVCRCRRVQRACLELALTTKQEAVVLGDTDDEEHPWMGSAWRADRRRPKDR